MKNQVEIENEIHKLEKVWNSLQGCEKPEALFFAMGALHALEWALSKETNALSNLTMLKLALKESEKSS